MSYKDKTGNKKLKATGHSKGVAELFDAVCTSFVGHTALVDGEGEETYAQLREKSARDRKSVV